MNNLPATLPAFIWHYLKNHKLALCGFVCTALIWSINMSLEPYLLKVMIDTVVKNQADQQKMLSLLLVPAGLFLVRGIVTSLGFRLYDYINLRIYPEIKSSVYMDMFTYLLSHSHEFFQSNFAGTLTKKMSDITGNIEQLIRIPNEWFYPRVMAMLIASSTLYYVVHPIFGIILFTWAIAFVGLSYMAARGSEKLSQDVSRAWSIMDGTTSDSISNILNTKLFANMTHEIEHLQKDVSLLVRNDRKLLWYNFKTAVAQACCLVLLTTGMLGGLIYGLTQGWVTAGDFALVLGLTITFVDAVFDMGLQMQQFFRIAGTCNQALSFVRVPHDIVDAPDAKPLTVTQGKIDFKKVAFAYQADQPLFHGLSVTLHPGEKVGLVGYSGGGKSTFIKLLLRLMDVQSGDIMIDGQSIAKVTKNTLRKNIGVIPQDPQLFHRSIMDNIRFARPEATDEEVIEASKRAKCHEFIVQLPDQYQAMVGERGVKLSGGQRQRIAIARAFLKNAPILVLDEATSSLDSITERYIQESLLEVMADKTTIVIAHRLSTLKHMDRIIVFVNGAIVEDGTVEQLLNNTQGDFYKLWHMQAEGFIH